VAHFQDFKKFFGKAASSCLLIFKNPRNVLINRMRELHFAIFKRILQIQKVLVLSSKELINSINIRAAVKQILKSRQTVS
jgi:hypothetical protein